MSRVDMSPMGYGPPELEAVMGPAMDYMAYIKAMTETIYRSFALSESDLDNRMEEVNMDTSVNTTREWPFDPAKVPDLAILVDHDGENPIYDSYWTSAALYGMPACRNKRFIRGQRYCVNTGERDDKGFLCVRDHFVGSNKPVLAVLPAAPEPTVAASPSPTGTAPHLASLIAGAPANQYGDRTLDAMALPAGIGFPFNAESAELAFHAGLAEHAILTAGGASRRLVKRGGKPAWIGVSEAVGEYRPSRVEEVLSTVVFPALPDMTPARVLARRKPERRVLPTDLDDHWLCDAEPEGIVPRRASKGE